MSQSPGSNEPNIEQNNKKWIEMDRNGGNGGNAKTNMARKMLETGKVSLNISSIDWWSEISDRVAPKGRTGRWKLLCWKCWTQKGEGQGSRFCPCSFMMIEGSWLVCTAYERYEPMWTDVNRCMVELYSVASAFLVICSELEEYVERFV